jgi:hypothetical protein
MALPKRLSGKVVQQQIINYYKERNTFLYSLKCFSAFLASSAPKFKTLKIHYYSTVPYRYPVQMNGSLGKVSKIVFPVFPVICRYY